MKALDKLHDISRTLASHYIDSPDKEAGIILRSALDMGLADIYRDNPELTTDRIRTIEQIVSRRINREPLQYIIGHVDFMGLKLLVGKGVLVPRPETELMAELAVQTVTSYKLQVTSHKLQVTSKNENSSLVTCHLSLRLLDLCTGSGCLALALAKEFPDAEVYGIDISDAALAYAKKNAELNNIGNVAFIRGDLFDPFKNPPESPFSKGGFVPPSLTKRGWAPVAAKHCNGKRRFSRLHPSFDLIISNPPYIKTSDIGNLQPEIKEWEPLNALDGGVNGLDCYREIIPAARQFLKPDGILMFELGIDCADDVKEMLQTSGYSSIESIKDYGGTERIVLARK